MNELTIGLLGALLATNQPLAVSNVIQEQTGVSVPVTADPVYRELQQVMIADDAAMDEVQKWIEDFSSQPLTNQTRSASDELNRKIMARFDTVRTAYGTFLLRHPDSAKGYLAYGTFLNDIGDEQGAKVQYLNSKQIDPKNPAVWNQLANYYGHCGELTNAFAHYTEAIRLDPAEPVYYQNFATTVFLYRKDAREFYHINEQQVFDKALGLYRQAMALEPDSLVLATDHAMSYYGIKPMRTNDALVAWTNALKTAHNDVEKEAVQIHLARTKISAGMYDEARGHLALVTNAVYADLKRRVTRSLNDHEHPSAEETSEGSTNVLEQVPEQPRPRTLSEATGKVASPTTKMPATTNDSSLPATNLMMTVPPPSIRPGTN
jgi:tetratricopeptide (TPR) repeat protein